MKNQPENPIVITHELACGVAVSMTQADLEWIRRRNKRQIAKNDSIIGLK